MIKCTLAISDRSAYLKLENQQLVALLPQTGHFSEERKQYPIEDLGVLLLENPQITITQSLLQALAEKGVVVIVCNQKHLPTSLLLPCTQHTELVPRLHLQINLKETRKKRLWQQIIKQKILQQKKQISYWQGIIEERRLKKLFEQVKTGDKEMHEAQAANIYWSFFFKKFTEGKVKRRDSSSNDSWNVSLNYGYAIIRAAIARAIVSAGFQPSLGIFHHRRGNAYCLADDLMEPLRPLVDSYLTERKNQLNENPDEFHSSIKKHLLSILTHPTLFNDSEGPLLVNLSRYLSSFYRYLSKEGDILQFPEPILNFD